MSDNNFWIYYFHYISSSKASLQNTSSLSHIKWVSAVNNRLDSGFEIYVWYQLEQEYHWKWLFSSTPLTFWSCDYWGCVSFVIFTNTVNCWLAFGSFSLSGSAGSAGLVLRTGSTRDQELYSKNRFKHCGRMEMGLKGNLLYTICDLERL